MIENRLYTGYIRVRDLSSVIQSLNEQRQCQGLLSLDDHRCCTAIGSKLFQGRTGRHSSMHPFAKATHCLGIWHHPHWRQSSSVQLCLCESGYFGGDPALVDRTTACSLCGWSWSPSFEIDFHATLEYRRVPIHLAIEDTILEQRHRAHSSKDQIIERWTCSVFDNPR